MDLLTLFSQPDTYVSLLTLTFLEIILGIDAEQLIVIKVGTLPDTHTIVIYHTFVSIQEKGAFADIGIEACI